MMPEPSTTDPSDSTQPLDSQLRDRCLLELQTTRNLQKAVSGIERFLLNQINRIEEAFAEAKQIEERGKVVQRLLVDFEEEKQAWEQRREQEMAEINAAKRKLAQGLRSLEDRESS